MTNGPATGRMPSDTSSIRTFSTVTPAFSNRTPALFIVCIWSHVRLRSYCPSSTPPETQVPLPPARFSGYRSVGDGRKVAWRASRRVRSSSARLSYDVAHVPVSVINGPDPSRQLGIVVVEDVVLVEVVEDVVDDVVEDVVVDDVLVVVVVVVVTGLRPKALPLPGAAMARPGSASAVDRASRARRFGYIDMISIWAAHSAAPDAAGVQVACRGSPRQTARRVALHMRRRRPKRGAVTPAVRRPAREPSSLPSLGKEDRGARTALRGLLLGQAVERPEAEHEVDGMDPDHWPRREEPGQHGQRLAVARVVEGRDEDRRVRDIEVGVARGQPLAGEDDRGGHRKRDDAQPPSVLVGHAREARAVVAQGRVVGIRWIAFLGDHHRSLVDEARDVVHVAVRVVARDPAAEPEDLPDAEVGAEEPLDRVAAHARVSRLHAREQAFLRREHGAPAVHVDRAALEDDRPRPSAVGHRRLPPATAEEPGQRVAHPRVPPVIAVLRPAVEAPADEPDVAVVAAHELRASVAHPRPVGRHTEELDPRATDAGAAQEVPGASLHAGVVDEDADALAGDEVTHDLGEDPRDGLELAWPIAPRVRPGEPRRGVRLPLGRHAVAERGGRRR